MSEPSILELIHDLSSLFFYSSLQIMAVCLDRHQFDDIRIAGDAVSRCGVIIYIGTSGLGPIPRQLTFYRSSLDFVRHT